MILPLSVLLGSGGGNKVVDYNNFYAGGGQSNFQGNTGTNVPSPINTTFSTIKQYKLFDGINPAGWYDFTPVNLQWGWFDYFLYLEQLRTGKTQYFYRYAYGGASLGTSANTYNRSILKTNGKAAWDLFKSQKPNARLIIPWSQCNADAITDALANDYENQLRGWFAELRAYFGEPNAIIIFDRYCINFSADATREATIRAAQASVDADSTKNIMLNADDIALVDTQHYSEAGCFTLGQRFSDTIITL